MHKIDFKNGQQIRGQYSLLRILLCGALLLLNGFAFAAPQSELWTMWDNSDEKNSATVNHQQWQQILDRYLVKQNQNMLFDYSLVTTKDQSQLKQYILFLSALDPRSYNRSEQFAYWVNLYNALTVKLILDNYPLQSITKLGGFFSFGPWDDKIVTVAKQSLTLNDIEHRILRPIWKDPRIHYVVNCASLGCPNLPSDALNGQNTETVLNRAAKQFINSDKGVRIDDKTLTLSSLYDWYGVDFGSNEQQILQHIDRYREKSTSGEGKLSSWKGKIKYDYDWSLNQP